MSEFDNFDVIVIGAGPAGENVAGRVTGGGLTAAIVERELVGGECSYWGCMPSKVLIRPGDVIAAAQRVPGVSTGPLDVAAVFARRDEITSNWDDTTSVPWLDSEHIALVRGIGRIAGVKKVDVTDANGNVRHLTANVAVVIATGTRAAMPPIEGLADSRPWDNRSVTAATVVPDRLLVLGGGAIGAEMAQAFRRLGSTEVTLVEGGERLVSREEPFAGTELREAFEAEGIVVMTGVTITHVVRPAADGPLTATLADGRSVEADEILVAVGRKPATSDIGLELVGLEPGRPVDVDDQLRATGVDGSWLYAVGDCNGKALLTHVGKYQARIAGDVILGKVVRDEVSRDAVPRVTFTDPQVCAVGLTLAQALERGLTVRVVSYDVGDVGGASVLGKGISGTAQIVVDEDTHLIVGATFTGPDVQELLHSATVAIVGRVPLERLWHAVPSYPTVSEVWLRLLEAYGL
jgi:dihydrolipoamide dehydrogenase